MVPVSGGPYEHGDNLGWPILPRIGSSAPRRSCRRRQRPMNA